MEVVPGHRNQGSSQSGRPCSRAAGWEHLRSLCLENRRLQRNCRGHLLPAANKLQRGNQCKQEPHCAPHCLSWLCYKSTVPLLVPAAVSPQCLWLLLARSGSLDLQRKLEGIAARLEVLPELIGLG